MIFTPYEIKELLEIIDAYTAKFVGQNIGVAHLTTSEKTLLAKYGIDVKQIRPTIDHAYKFGMLSEALSAPMAKSMTYDQLKKHLISKQFLPLDFREQKALDSLRYQAFHQIKGLGNKVKNDFQSIMIEVDKRQRIKYEDVIKDAAKTAIVNRESLKSMASEIGHKTGDWARDLDRIADYVLHDAHDNGRAAQIQRNLGKDALVYKHVFDQACKHCVRLYLTAGRGSQPVVFRVRDLIKNGNNIGVKQKNWKPVIGSTHPWCRCEVESLPIGSVWDDKEKRFKVQLTEREKEIRSKIKFKMES